MWSEYNGGETLGIEMFGWLFMAIKAKDGSQGMCPILDSWDFDGLSWIALYMLKMMMNLFVIRNVLELWIDKYLLIDAMTRNFLTIYYCFKFLDFSQYSHYATGFSLESICELYHNA